MAQFIYIAAIVAGVTNADGIPLPTLDSGADRVSADCRFYNLIDIFDPQSVTRGSRALNREIYEVTPGRAFRKDAACIGEVAQSFFNRHRRSLNPRQIRT